MAMKHAMLIHFLGATRTTTGSMYLFEIGGQRLLLECGLFQGKRGESIERNCCFPFDPRQVTAVVLSHAHIDHCGNLPNLCRQGFSGNIKKISVIHGEESQCLAFAVTLRKLKPQAEVIVPEYRQ